MREVKVRYSVTVKAESISMKNHKNNRKPALEESLKARQEGRWTRSKTWGGKRYNRKEGKKVGCDF